MASLERSEWRPRLFAFASALIWMTAAGMAPEYTLDCSPESGAEKLRGLGTKRRCTTLAGLRTGMRICDAGAATRQARRRSGVLILHGWAIPLTAQTQVP